MMKIAPVEAVNRAAAQADALLSQMGLTGRKFTAEELAARWRDVWGQQVLLMPFECPPRADGALLVVGGRFVICYQANTDELHRRHIVLHELAHLYLGHKVQFSNGWLLFSASDERDADLLADQLVARSLGIREAHLSLWHRLARRWFGEKRNSGRRFLGSLFD